ncbi:MAG: hypothetical protein E4H20_01270, partial [Spirochaetales bacterium]
MDMKKNRTILVLAVMATAMVAFAASWEGNAMMGSYGDFPASGFYAACNSFARNSSVEVTNLENGRTVTVLVTRGLETPGIFMMLSLDAANALGLQSGRVARIRTAEPKSAFELAPAKGSTTIDPDFNPRLYATEELKRLGYQLDTAPAAPTASAVAVVPKTGTTPAVTAVPAEPVKPASPATDTKPVEVVVAPHTETVEAAGETALSATLPVASAPGPESPELFNGKKPKLVRTVLLPQLPEPGVPAKAVPVPETAATSPVAATVLAESPEVVAMGYPQPDEAPLKVEAVRSPKRYDAPSVLPEASSPRTPVPASAPLTASLSDPAVPGSDSALAYELVSPSPRYGDSEVGLVDPGAKASGGPEAPVAYTWVAPVMAPGAQGPELAWPQLEADEIPEAVVMARLAKPAEEIPATSLAEGEVQFLGEEIGPTALAMETPSLGAAETTVALADASPLTGETPSATDAGRLAPLEAPASASLSEPGTPSAAAPGTSAAAPAETVLSLEPTDLKPPAGTPVETRPTASAIAPVAATVQPSAGALQRGNYYIQVAAYRSESTTREAIAVLDRAGYVTVIE